MLSRKLRQQRPLVIDPVAMLEISKRIYGNGSQQKGVQTGASEDNESLTGKEEAAVTRV